MTIVSQVNKVLIPAFVISLFSTALVARADYRVATVDINRVINETQESKSQKKVLDQKFQDAKKKIDAKREALKTVEAKIKSGEIKEGSKEADKYRSDAREFTLLVKDTEDELRGKFMESNKTLTEKAVKLIKDYAEKNKYDLILDKSDKERGPVLFATPTVDITESVIKEMNG